MHKNMSLKDCAVVYRHSPARPIINTGATWTYMPTYTYTPIFWTWLLPMTWWTEIMLLFLQRGRQNKQNKITRMKVIKQNAHNASGHYCTTVHRVWSVNSHSIKECELSFHQTSYKRYTTMCDVYIIHIQGATVCYIHPPEKKKEKPWHNHHTCTLPHPSPTRPAIQSQPAHPRVLRIHITYVHRQTRLRYHSGPCSSWRGSAERKRSSSSCPCLWLLLHGCCVAGKDSTLSTIQGWTVPPPHLSKPIFHLSSAFVPNSAVTCWCNCRGTLCVCVCKTVCV